MTAGPQSKAAWKARLEPHLATSLRDASDSITRTEVVQDWLREASMEAAEGVGSTSGMQGKMEGYVHMMRALEDRFPDLLRAVEELTEGCATIDLHWRPLQPSYSRLYVDFRRDISADVFVRLSERTQEATERALQTVADALPKGTPFPNRPSTATGIVASEGQCLGVRVKAHLSEDRTRQYQTVTLLPKAQDPIENQSMVDAAQQLLRVLARSDAASTS